MKHAAVITITVYPSAEEMARMCSGNASRSCCPIEMAYSHGGIYANCPFVRSAGDCRNVTAVHWQELFDASGSFGTEASC